jgi:hypothetical protein
VKGKLGRVGEYMEELAEGEKVWWACEYVKDMYEIKLWRGEQVAKAVANIKSGFLSFSGPHLVWEHVSVRNMVATCRRTPYEVRQDIIKRAAIQKYDINFDIMYDLREATGARNFDWTNPSKDKVDLVLLFMLACIMFDIGLRPSNTVDLGPAEQYEDGGDDPKAEEALELAMERQGHCQQNGDWTWAVVYPGGDVEDPTLLEGGERFADFLVKNPNKRVLYGSPKFPTGKMTSGRGRNGAQAVTGTMIARRTPVEAEFLDLVINFWRWNGNRTKTSPVFRRRGMKFDPQGNRYRSAMARNLRTCELVDLLKMLAVARGVRESHVSAVSFRKGNLSTCVSLGRQEILDEAKEVESAARRGSKWVATSRVPTNNYLLTSDDRGPFSRVFSWREARTVGGGVASWITRQGAVHE